MSQARKAASFTLAWRIFRFIIVLLAHVYWLYGGSNESAEKVTFLKSASSAGSSHVVVSVPGIKKG